MGACIAFVIGDGVLFCFVFFLLESSNKVRCEDTRKEEGLEWIYIYICCWRDINIPITRPCHGWQPTISHSRHVIHTPFLRPALLRILVFLYRIYIKIYIFCIFCQFYIINIRMDCQFKLLFLVFKKKSVRLYIKILD